MFDRVCVFLDPRPSLVYNCRVLEQFFDLPMGPNYPIELLPLAPFLNYKIT